MLADPEAWSRDPWSGDLADGCVWGRGALDMKSQVAAEVAAAVALAAQGWRPARGDLSSSRRRTRRPAASSAPSGCAERHPDAVRCDFLLNEGGGAVHRLSRPALLPGVLRREGRLPLHASSPPAPPATPRCPCIGDNALLKMAPVLEACARSPAYDLTDEPRALLGALGVDVDGDAARAVLDVSEHDPAMALLVEPMLGVTVTPTRIKASDKINVIPARAELRSTAACRRGWTRTTCWSASTRLLGADGYELEITRRWSATARPSTRR